jgi:hypothetical protein
MDSPVIAKMRRAVQEKTDELLRLRSQLDQAVATVPAGSHRKGNNGPTQRDHSRALDAAADGTMAEPGEQSSSSDDVEDGLSEYSRTLMYTFLNQDTFARAEPHSKEGIVDERESERKDQQRQDQQLSKNKTRTTSAWMQDLSASEPQRRARFANKLKVNVWDRHKKQWRPKTRADGQDVGDSDGEVGESDGEVGYVGDVDVGGVDVGGLGDSDEEVDVGGVDEDTSGDDVPPVEDHGGPRRATKPDRVLDDNDDVPSQDSQRLCKTPKRRVTRAMSMASAETARTVRQNWHKALDMDSSSSSSSSDEEEEQEAHKNAGAGELDTNHTTTAGFDPWAEREEAEPQHLLPRKEIERNTPNDDHSDRRMEQRTTETDAPVNWMSQVDNKHTLSAEEKLTGETSIVRVLRVDAFGIEMRATKLVSLWDGQAPGNIRRKMAAWDALDADVEDTRRERCAPVG